VEGNPEKYVGLSLQLLDLYVSYSPDVEPFSVDEAFVGLDRRLTLTEAKGVAAEIQSAIDQRFRLGASIGVGPNKLVAKMGAGLQKPRGLTALDEAAFRDAFWPRDVREMWGVGPKLATRMRSLGITTVGELARAPREALGAAFGVIGPQLKEAAWGRDETPLVPYHQGVDAKSMGHEVTLPRDCADVGFLTGTLLRLSDQVARRLRGEGYAARVVAIKLRDSRFQTVTRQRVLSDYTDDHLSLYHVARSLFLANWKRDPVRLIGVTAASLARRGEEQTELFDRARRSRSLSVALDRLRDRWGEASLVPAGTITHRRELGHVPFGAMTSMAGRPKASRKHLIDSDSS
jgi:DNA polymerase-4